MEFASSTTPSPALRAQGRLRSIVMNTAALNARAADATATGEAHTKDQKEHTGLERSVIAGLAPDYPSRARNTSSRSRQAACRWRFRCFDEPKATHGSIIVTPAPCGVLPLCACALVVPTSPFDPHSSSRLLLTNIAMRQTTKTQSHHFIYAHPSVRVLSGLLSCLIAIRLGALARCALCSSLLGVAIYPQV